jgi:hypothetical protein
MAAPFLHSPRNTRIVRSTVAPADNRAQETDALPKEIRERLWGAHVFVKNKIKKGVGVCLREIRYRFEKGEVYITFIHEYGIKCLRYEY